MNEPLETMFKKMDACIHCGMCLPTCPTYRVTGSEAESPRGRLFLMREHAEGHLDSPKQLALHLDPCLGCLACVTACPSGVEYDTLLSVFREELVPHQPRWKRALRRFFLKDILPNPVRLNRMAQGLALYQKSGLQAFLRQPFLQRLLGPLASFEQLTPRIQPGKPWMPGTRVGENRKGTVALFTGCIMNAAFRQVHQATVEVLARNGYEVFVPEQTCCGALAHHAGETDIAVSLAEANVRSILAANPDWIVINSAGCGSTLREYHHILSELPEGEAFARKVVDVMALLAQHPLEGELFPLPFTVTYQAACHLHHAQRVQEEPYAVLRQIPDLRLIPLTEAEMCCGSAGVYNLAHPNLSTAILAEKMAHVAKTQADVVLAANPGCMLQLESGIRQAGLEMRVAHPVEVLALAYDPPHKPSLLHRVK